MTHRVSSTTIRDVPGVCRPTKLAPAVELVSTSTAVTTMPADSAEASVWPTAATWGSVKMTRGESGPSLTTRASLPRIASAASRPWYLPMCVSSVRPFASPIA